MSDCSHVFPVMKLMEVVDLPRKEVTIGVKIVFYGSWCLSGDNVVCESCGEMWGNVLHAMKKCIGVDCHFDDVNKVYKLNFGGIRDVFGSCDLGVLERVDELVDKLVEMFVFDNVDAIIPNKWVGCDVVVKNAIVELRALREFVKLHHPLIFKKM